ncbi:Mariner Mos1 transposase [Eumeta japonica]|uniref:Mariner Mos1 transposase n=1 Tax=Eumeta variegata TaxID=151549 RepID=A0A4C1T2Z2_EUMVA|nr:Mariner Mos1 transposase [Eumeta japonica]
MSISQSLKEKRPLYKQKHKKKILLHDNAQSHVAKTVKTYLETLQWEVLPYPPYSPDITSSNFHLFHSMAHGLADQRFNSYEEVKKWIDSWIASKNMTFFRCRIHILPEKWERVVSSDGQYFK